MELVVVVGGGCGLFTDGCYGVIVFT